VRLRSGSSSLLPFGGLSGLNFVHGLHDGIIDFGSDLIYLEFSVQGPSHCLICLNELLQLIRQLIVLLVQKSHMLVESFNLQLQLLRVSHMLRVHIFHMLDFILVLIDFIFSGLELLSGFDFHSLQVLPSEVLKLVCLAQLLLSLLVLIVLAFKVLDLLV